MAALDNIASELLKSANEADLIYKRTRDQAQRDKAVRLRRIVENLKAISAGGLTPTLDEVLTEGNVSTNTINVGGITSDYFQLDTTATPTLAPGMFAWNDAYGTADLRLKGNNVTLQVGQETLARVVNKTGSDLLESQYKVVRVRIASEGGAQGQRLAVVLAQGNNDPDSATTLGIVTEDIPNNQEGFITIFGNVNNINTTGSLQGETWVDGDVLYLSPTTPGAITKVKPVAPQHTVIIGYVVYAHNNQGKIFVKVDNGYELDELHNVLITSPANNDLLQYNSTQQVWKNVASSVAVPTPTLAQVTTAGNTTTNAITVGGLTSNASSIIIGAAAGTLGSRVLTIQGSLPEIFFKDTFGSGSGFSLSKYGSLFYFVNTTSAGAYTNYAGVINPLAASWSFGHGGNPSATVHIKGADVLSSTKALLVQNSSPTDLLTIWNDGAVGINTSTNAGYKLDVNGTSRFQGSVTNTSGGFISTLTSPTSDAFYTFTSGAIGFYTSHAYTKAQRLNLTNTTGLPSTPNNVLLVSGSITASSALAAGVFFNNTLVAAANNDVLVGLDIAPTFTNGAFTGVKNFGLRTTNTNVNLSGVLTVDYTNYQVIIGSGLTIKDDYIYNYSWIGTTISRPFYFYVNNSDVARFTTSGNFIIGSGTPADAGYKLDVNGTIRSSGTNGLVLYDGTYGAKVSMSSYNFTIEREGTYGVSTYLFKYSDGTTALNLNSTSIVGLPGDDAVMMSRNVYARHNAAFGFTTYGGTTKYKAIQAIYTDNNTSGVAFNYKTGGTDTEAMRITSAGFIGFGTTSPLFKVDISNRVMLGQYPASSTYGAVYLGNITPSNTNYSLTSNSVDTYLNGTSNLNFSINDVIKARIASTGNVLIGTTTDAGYKLDVSGTVRFTHGLTIDYFGATIGGVTLALSSQAGGTISSGASAGNNNGPYITLSGPAYLNPTAGNSGMFSITGLYYASSGTAIFNHLNLAPTINNSGTYSGIVRGIYYNPTLTSLTGTTHRAIETTSGDVIFNGGQVGIGTTSFYSDTKLKVKGVDSALILLVSGSNYGVRIGANSVGGVISGVDQTGFGSDQALNFRATKYQLDLGNVLIGTTTDAGYKLDVNGTSRFTQAVVVNAGGVKTESGTITAQTGVNSGRMMMFNLRNTGGGFQSAVGTSLAISFTNREVAGVWSDDVIENIVYSNTAGSVTTGYNFYTHNNQVYNASPVLAMSINGLNVGIGTPTPTDKLHIVDNTNGNKFARISAGGTDASAAWVAQNDQVDNIVYRVFGSAVTGSQMGQALARSASLIVNLGGTGKFLIGSYSGTDLIFGTSDQARMRLVDATGNFLIGTMTDTGNKLTVSGNIDAQGYKVNNVLGYTGILNIPTNPPGQQNIDIQGGIVINIF